MFRAVQSSCHIGFASHFKNFPYPFASCHCRAFHEPNQRLSYCESANAASPDVIINVQHCAFDSPLAQQLGRELGRKVGTAKHVARAAGIPVDWEAVRGLIERNKSSLSPGYRPSGAARA